MVDPAVKQLDMPDEVVSLPGVRDGTEVELKPGGAFEIGPGHDAWVVGPEAGVSLDFLPGA